MLALSKRTENLVETLFSDERTRNTVRSKLISECGNNIPDCEKSNAEEMERVRFSVIKLSEGDANKLDDAIELAKLDWRDLFMAAGFGDDTDAHNEWYEEITNAQD